MPAPVPGSLTVTDFSRGWDPTHPDEQLVGANLAPGAQFGASAGAPFYSPDVHDVDFWRGYLEKRNGKSPVGNPLSNAPVLGLYRYVFANAFGSLSKILVALCNSAVYWTLGSIWTENLSVVWTAALFSYFSTIKNLLFMSPVYNLNGVPVSPRWWDGASQNFGYHAPRMSPPYLLRTEGNYSAANIANVSGTLLTMAPGQPASGLYIGKQIWVFNTSYGYMEPNTISSFQVVAPQGSAGYCVLAISLGTPLKYPGSDYSGVCWNGGTVAVATGGSGTITTSGSVTCIRLLAVTSLASGGQRSSEFSVDVPVGSTGSIVLSNLQMSYGDGTLFGTDINNLATTWYMTAPFNPQLSASDPNGGLSQTFYRIPDNQGMPTNTSLGFNPMPNSTTGFTIYTTPTVSSAITLVADTGVDAPGYFTSQVDAPFYQFSVAWQDFLVLAGDMWNPSAIWISAYGAPQVFGTQGGLDGAFIQVPNGNDGQVITGLFVWQGNLYIFKTNSVYVCTFTGNTSVSPFQVQQLQSNYGAVSPRSIAAGDVYLYFMSSSGLCAINGLTAQLLPENDQIRYQFLESDGWNISALGLSQAFSLQAKKQIYFQMADAVLGDVVLVYDWSRRNFLYHTGGIKESALFQDPSVSPPQLYGGDYAGQVWTLDVIGTDENPPINMYYSTPWLNLGDSAAWKFIKWIWVSGVQQNQGTLNILVYEDFNFDVANVFPVDMTKNQFAQGQWVAINLRAHYFKIVLQNNQLNTPVQVRVLRIDYENQGPQL